MSISLLSLLSLFSCSNEINEKAYQYNSVEYINKLKEFNITLKEASFIASDLYFKNNPDIKEYKCILSIVLGDYYIFSNTYFYNDKTREHYLSGIWVNGKTAKVVQKETEKFVVIQLEISSPPGLYRRVIERKE